jgi:putative acetyltransferase
MEPRTSEACGSALHTKARRSGAGRVCEVKRLFVRESFQGLAIGRTLMGKLLDHAKHLQYDVVVLDTLDRLTAANSLYASLGFEKSAPYYDNPLNGVKYWAKRLV